MDKEIEIWTVQNIREKFAQINFPEYQREPNVWSRSAKQRLIDSISRKFDIAPLYFYRNEDETLDCVDGRQRIGAILSFFEENSKDEADNGYEFRVLNEIYTDERYELLELNGKSYAELLKLEAGNHLIQKIKEHKITVVLLMASLLPEEFNLQFTRLNLGTIINSGEKLHAMMGELRDTCFEEEKGLCNHPFLEGVAIPTRRYAKESLLAQILAEVFELASEDGDFARIRHVDLQSLFKRHVKMDEEHRSLVEQVRHTFDVLAKYDGQRNLRNRAVTVSVVALGWRLRLYDDEVLAQKFCEFVHNFLDELKQQVAKKLDVPNEFRYLIDFQKDLTQASVEKPALKRRHEVLQEEFDRWLASGKIEGRQ